MKILFIAPIPPPITGQSLATKIFLNELQKCHSANVANFNKGTFEQGVSSFARIIEVVKILKEIWVGKKDADVVYLTISQSIAGNIKDLLTYLICFKKLPKMIIHLHGGGIRKLIFDKYRFLYYLNKFLLKRLLGAVVLGRSLIPIFEGMIPKDKIHIVPNFAEDYLFLSKNKIEKKFKKINPLKILFLSNLIPGKGHEELVDAYKSLNNDLQRAIRIDFAGGFESEDKKKVFLNKIEGVEGLYYHGIVNGAQKKQLFSNAHLFCLPTYYYYEGQPISILEAYASGCVVITTNHGGICDIFHDGVNGFEVKKKSSSSIEKILVQILSKPEHLLSIALSNHKIACKQYRTSIYLSSMLRIIEDVAKKR